MLFYAVFLNNLSLIISSYLSLSFPGNFKAYNYLFSDSPLSCCSLGKRSKLIEERTELRVLLETKAGLCSEPIIDAFFVYDPLFYHWICFPPQIQSLETHKGSYSAFGLL